jgi:predicted double-glycine peptidase
MGLRKYRIPRGSIRVAVPDTTQQKDYSCGASGLQAVCKYYGVGYDDEWEFVDALDMDHRIGSHPYQIKKVAHRCGLRTREYQPMTVRQLQRELGWRHPVMLMIQAWGQARVNGYWRWRTSYADHWDDGHWVVAIGYSPAGVFFEDPSLQGVRGFLTYAELASRWHDTGPRQKQVPFYGLAIWHPQRRRSAYESHAERIG